MEKQLIEKVEEKIQHILDDDITPNNIDNLVKLAKIKHYAKEDENMNYGNYNGRGPVHGSYGNYNEGYGRGYGEYNEYGNYGRRGYDMKYRGAEHIDRMAGEYGRYMEGRERYGANEETDRSYHYMVKALEDFIRVLYEEASNEQQKQQLRETLQRSMM